jgi:hypothetical protein
MGNEGDGLLTGRPFAPSALDWALWNERLAAALLVRAAHCPAGRRDNHGMHPSRSPARGSKLLTAAPHSAKATAWLLAALSAGCAPALDWREVRAPGHALQMLFPCKPSAQERRVQLSGQAMTMLLQACAAGGQTWGVASVELGDPTLVGRALTELGAAAASNIGAAVPVAVAGASQVPGATPNPASQQTSLQGTMPDGKAVQMRLALFAHGTRVYQATVLGPQVPAEAAQTFLGALRLVP